MPEQIETPPAEHEGRDDQNQNRQESGAVLRRVPWHPNGIAFCWQPKQNLRLIRESLDGENTVATAMLVYVVLTEIASDRRSDTFQTTHAFIASRCGLSARTVRARIKDLVELGLLEVTIPGLKTPGIYRLILPDAQPLPNDRQPLPNDRQPSFFAPLPRSEEVDQDLIKNDPKNARFEKPTLEAVKQRTLDMGLPESEAGAFYDYYESNGWKVGRVPMRSWHAALNNWKRNWQKRQTRSAQRQPETNQVQENLTIPVL